MNLSIVQKLLSADFDWFRQGIITEVAGAVVCFLLWSVLERLIRLGEVTFAAARERRERRVTSAPGHRAVRFADTCLTMKSASVVHQIVADMRHEYFAALRADHRFLAKGIVIVYYVAIARAFAITRPLVVVAEAVSGIVVGPRR